MAVEVPQACTRLSSVGWGVETAPEMATSGVDVATIVFDAERVQAVKANTTVMAINSARMTFLDMFSS
jgi:hypothetical protein